MQEIVLMTRLARAQHLDARCRHISIRRHPHPHHIPTTPLPHPYYPLTCNACRISAWSDGSQICHT